MLFCAVFTSFENRAKYKFYAYFAKNILLGRKEVFVIKVIDFIRDCNLDDDIEIKLCEYENYGFGDDLCIHDCLTVHASSFFRDALLVARFFNAFVYATYIDVNSVIVCFYRR